MLDTDPLDAAFNSDPIFVFYLSGITNRTHGAGSKYYLPMPRHQNSTEHRQLFI